MDSRFDLAKKDSREKMMSRLFEGLRTNFGREMLYSDEAKIFINLATEMFEKTFDEAYDVGYCNGAKDEKQD